MSDDGGSRIAARAGSDADQSSGGPSGRSLPLAGAFVAGVALAVQSRLNGSLGGPLSEPLAAALWNFTAGLVLLSLTLVHPAQRHALSTLGHRIRTRTLRPWECVGGALGALFVATQTSVVGTLGVALFTVATVGGQTIGGMLVDTFGVGPHGRAPVTLRRMLAASFAIIGVGITVSGKLHGTSFSLGVIALVLLAGMLTQVQQGLNGRVTASTHSPFAATVQNFAVGLVALLIVLSVRLGFGITHWQWPTDAPWWTFLGAPLGIVFVGLSAWATRRLGVFVLGLVSLMGQLVAALCLDLADASTRRSVGALTVIGMLVTAVAATVAALPRGRVERPSRTR